MTRQSELARQQWGTPPDVRWPGCFCPMCHGCLQVMKGGWCCMECDAAWLYDGTAGMFAEPDKQAA